MCKKEEIIYNIFNKNLYSNAQKNFTDCFIVLILIKDKYKIF